MGKLLRANFSRMLKSKFLWVSSALLFLLGLVPIDRYYVNVKYAVREKMWSLDEDFFTYSIFIFFITTILTALYVGVEYSGGTLRNKIAVGAKRTTVYFSYLITLIVADIFLCAVYITTALSVGVPLLGMLECGLSNAILLMLLTLALTVAVTSIMLMISMLCSNRTYSSIICLVTAMLLIISAAFISGVVNEPEYYEGVSYVSEETGEIISEPRELNPNYVSGTERVVLEKLLDIIPGGQLITVLALNAENTRELVLYDLAILVLTTGIGLVLFKRKDLK